MTAVLVAAGAASVATFVHRPASSAAAAPVAAAGGSGSPAVPVPVVAMQSPAVWLPASSNESIELGDQALSLDLVLGNQPHLESDTTSDTGIINDEGGQAMTATVTLPSGAVDRLPGSGPDTFPSLGAAHIGLSPSTTTLEGSAEGLQVDLQATRPTLPSAAVTDATARITDSPVMYLRLAVHNTGRARTAASSVALGGGSPCGTGTEASGIPGWTTLTYCGPDEQGRRALTAADAALTPAHDGNLHLNVPALAAGARWNTVVLYSGWTDSPALSGPAAEYGFYYHRWWSSAAQMRAAALASTIDVLRRSLQADVADFPGPTTTTGRLVAIHALRAWRRDSWLTADASGAPFSVVSEGTFGWLSTIDVAYEYQMVQNRFEPWRSILELQEWRSHRLVAGTATLLPHDIGTGNTVTDTAAYDDQAKSRLRPAENDADDVLMTLAAAQATHEPFDKDWVADLLEGAESQDKDGDGILDVAKVEACTVATHVCKTDDTGTTYDGDLEQADQQQAGNVVVSLKVAVAEATAAAAGVTRPGGGASFATTAQHRLAAVLPHLDVWSTDTKASGASAHPGYLADGLAYLPILGVPPALAPSLGTIAKALVSNDNAVTAKCGGTCVPRAGTAETTVWLSKVVDGAAVSSWLAATHPGLPRTPTRLDLVAAAMVNRPVGSPDGTLEMLTGDAQRPTSVGDYPRLGAAWAWKAGVG